LRERRGRHRPGMGEPAPPAAWSGTLVGEELCQDVEPDPGRGPQRADPDRLDRKEELRTLLATVRVGGDPHLTRHRLHRFLTWCVDSQIPELLTLAATIDDWWPEINAFVTTGITNARTEGSTRLVKQVKLVSCGFRNLEHSARRIRFHCTRKQRAGGWAAALAAGRRDDADVRWAGVRHGTAAREALGLDRGDVDPAIGVLTIREAKFHKSRQLPCIPPPWPRSPPAQRAGTGCVRVRVRARCWCPPPVLDWRPPRCRRRSGRCCARLGSGNTARRVARAFTTPGTPSR
ncbi:MAG: hypothetical protein QOH52_2318, partial [Pseudonocardiales bacterium]|nr:hypothetical protein [Pseudonocardiales bacterium]